MKKPITQDLVKEIKSTKQNLTKLYDQITKRVDYILKTLFNAFKIKSSGWWFHTGDFNDSEHGCAYIDFTQSTFEVAINYPRIKNYKIPQIRLDDKMICLKNGEFHNFDCNEIPIRWLFEDFEEELTAGINQIKEQESKIKNEANEKQKKKTAILKKVKSKLSKEELEVLFPEKK